MIVPCAPGPVATTSIRLDASARDDLFPGRLLLRDAGRELLRRPVFFWARAWSPAKIGVWEELGPTPLALLEFFLIGVAGLVSPALLNRERLARRR